MFLERRTDYLDGPSKQLLQLVFFPKLDSSSHGWIFFLFPKLAASSYFFYKLLRIHNVFQLSEGNAHQNVKLEVKSFRNIPPDLIIRPKVSVLNGAEHPHHRFKMTALSHCFKSIRYKSNNDISFFAAINVLLACMLVSEETKKWKSSWRFKPSVEWQRHLMWLSPFFVNLVCSPGHPQHLYLVLLTGICQGLFAQDLFLKPNQLFVSIKQ